MGNHCSSFKECTGYEWYVRKNWFNKKTCFLNNKYPNKGLNTSVHACYRYKAPCPYRNTLVPLKDQWIDGSVCPVVDKLRCSTLFLFECPAGYYPVCGDLPGTGFKMIVGISYDECAQKCNNYDNDKCVGFEWTYRRTWHYTKTCILNSKYATNKRYPGQHSCYRYGAHCPVSLRGTPAPTPVKPVVPVKPVKPVYKPCQCEKFCKAQATDMLLFPILSALFGGKGKKNNNNKNNNNKNNNNKVTIKRVDVNTPGICHCDCSKYNIKPKKPYVNPKKCQCKRYCTADPEDMFFFFPCLFGGKKKKRCHKKHVNKVSPAGAPGVNVKGHRCSREHQTCRCNGWVRYGTYYHNNYSKLTAWRKVNGSIGCNNGVWGDPHYGTVKRCYCYNFPKPTPKPAPKPAPKPIIVGGMPSASVKGYDVLENIIPVSVMDGSDMEHIIKIIILN